MYSIVFDVLIKILKAYGVIRSHQKIPLVDNIFLPLALLLSREPLSQSLSDKQWRRREIFILQGL